MMNPYLLFTCGRHRVSGQWPRLLLLAVAVQVSCAVSSLAAPAERPLQRIALGSCAVQTAPQPIWDRITATRPDLFLFLGDTVYADTEDMDRMRADYAKLAAQPGFRKLRRTCPILATWDDHDYGVNDGDSTYPKRMESQQVFLDFFGEPADSPRRKRPGVYDARVFGPSGKRVQVIMLDTRYFRTPWKRSQQPGVRYEAAADPGATILGEVQWKWLEEQLRVPAEVRLIASSIQVVAQDQGFEKWMNFPRERERLFRLIRDSGANGGIFVSGDVHIAELCVMNGGVGYPLFDLTTSGLNNGDPNRWRQFRSNRHLVGTLNWGNNFGLITVDWERPDPQISLQIRDEAGEIAVQRKIPLSSLKRGTLPLPAP